MPTRVQNGKDESMYGTGTGTGCEAPVYMWHEALVWACLRSGLVLTGRRCIHYRRIMPSCTSSLHFTLIISSYGVPSGMADSRGTPVLMVYEFWGLGVECKTGYGAVFVDTLCWDP